MLSSVRPLDAAGRQPPACMGVRGPGPDHPKRARSTVESPGCPSPVSPTVAPYSPSARPYVLAIVVSLRCRGRSSVGAAFDQQGPDDACHLVGQSNGDQHFRLASQHLRKPRPLGCPAPAGLLDHGTRPDDQQAPDRPFTAFRNGAEFLLAASRFLQRRQSEPGREIAPGREPSAAGTSAVIAVEVIGPTPGIVINRRAVGSDFERWLISASNAAICASNAVKVSTSSLRMTRALSGSEDCRSSTTATRVSTWVMPFGKTWPYSVRCPRRALTHWVRCRTRRSRARNTMPFACCSSVLTATKRMLGRWAASQIASASAASFFCRLMNGLT